MLFGRFGPLQRQIEAKAVGLLDEERDIVDRPGAAGQSEFTRGVCWVTPIEGAREG